MCRFRLLGNTSVLPKLQMEASRSGPRLDRLVGGEGLLLQRCVTT